MVNEHHLELLKQDVDAWNTWRLKHAEVTPDLSDADLSCANLTNADLSRALLCNTVLSNANLSYANFFNSNLFCADLSEANLFMASLNGAFLEFANLTGANLELASLTSVYVDSAIFLDCCVRNISISDLHGQPRVQEKLFISRPDEPAIIVDSLELAQFVTLILTHRNLRSAMNVIASKAVLILGCYEEQGPYLEAIAEQLRHCRRYLPDGSMDIEQEYLPIICDFDPSKSVSSFPEWVSSDESDLLSRFRFTEAIHALTQFSRFIIVDITNLKNAPQDLVQVIIELAQVPVCLVYQLHEFEGRIFAEFPLEHNQQIPEIEPVKLAEIPLEHNQQTVRTWHEDLELSDKSEDTRLQREWPWTMFYNRARFPWLIEPTYSGYLNLDDLRGRVTGFAILAEQRMEELKSYKSGILAKAWLLNRPESQLFCCCEHPHSSSQWLERERFNKWFDKWGESRETDS